MQNHDDIFPDVPEFQSAPSNPPPEPTPESTNQPDQNDDNPELTDEEIAAAFRRDLLYVIPPFRSAGEASTLLCVAILLTLMPFLGILPQMCCLFWVIYLGILGSLASFFFTILTDTSQGNYHIPYLNSLFTTIAEDFWGGVFVPISNFYLASLYAFMPSFIVSAVYYLITGESTGPADWPLPLLLALISLGAFLIPVVMIVLAHNRLTLLFRPLLILNTIKKIGKPYLIGWLCLEFCLVLSTIIYVVSPQAQLNISGRTILIMGFCFLDVSIWVFAMRALGLINRFYSHRFPWHDYKPVILNYPFH